MSADFHQPDANNVELFINIVQDGLLAVVNVENVSNVATDGTNTRPSSLSNSSMPSTNQQIMINISNQLQALNDGIVELNKQVHNLNEQIYYLKYAVILFSSH